MDSKKSFDFSALLRDHTKKHKAKPSQFGSVAGGVEKRLESRNKIRRSSRLNIFDSVRDLERSENVKQQSEMLTKIEHRKMQLDKWKEERDKKKKEAAAQKKKPFVTGVPHAPLKFVPPPRPTKVMPSTSGRVTRSQSANNKATNTAPTGHKDTLQQPKMVKSFAPKNAIFVAPEIKNMSKVHALPRQCKMKKNKESITFDPVVPNLSKNAFVSKAQPKILRADIPKESINMVTKPTINENKERFASGLLTVRNSNSVQHSSSGDMSPILEKSMEKSPKMTPKISVPENETVTPKNPVPKSESNSEERLRSPKCPLEVSLTPKQTVEFTNLISPNITLSRGKENARREMMKKIKEGLLEDDSNVDSVDHFRQQLDFEIKRMTERCETWETVAKQIALPEAVQDALLGATGQARLLMSSKLQQFAKLVARCEFPEPGQASVTLGDLQGFWDMVFIQVENVNMRFKKLEEMRARNWADDAPAAAPNKPARRANKPRAAAKRAALPAATSRLRDMIAAARKAKKQEPEVPVEPGLQEVAEANKSFEAGFFCVRSPVRESPCTPARQPSLLKAVLSSEAKNFAANRSTSLAMLRASSIGKSVEDDGALAESPVPLTPIDLHATPGRSILKSHDPLQSTGKKSIKVVLFNDSDASDTAANELSHAEEVSGVHRLEDADEEEQRRDDATAVSEMISSIDIKSGTEVKENRDSHTKVLLLASVEERSPVMTRSRRKSMTTPARKVSADDSETKTSKRSSRKK